MMVLAVADFLGTTLGCCLGAPGFLEAAPPFFLDAAASCSESSSLMGRGLAFALVTNPDFLFVTGVGFFLFLSDVGSFLLGLLVGLLCNGEKSVKDWLDYHFNFIYLTCLLLAELSESEELPDPLEEDEDDPDEDEDDVLEPEVLPLIRGFGGILEICEQF